MSSLSIAVQNLRSRSCMPVVYAQQSSRDTKNGSGGIPPWKRYQKKKGIGKQAEATLEMMWSRTEWLSEEQIHGMWDMHRVRREQVIDWFAKKRKERRSKKYKEKVEDDDEEEEQMY